MNLNRILNPVIGLTGLAALVLSATLAYAEVKEKMKIKVMTGDGVSETVMIEDLQVGETDVFVTESGKEVLVSRGEEALTLEVEGRQIEVKLPSIHSMNGHGEGHVKHRVFVSKDGDLESLEADEGKQIVIHKEVHGHLTDEELAELMQEVDIDVEVEGNGGQDHEVIMIKKRIVTEAVEEAATEIDAADDRN